MTKAYAPPPSVERRVQHVDLPNHPTRLQLGGLHDDVVECLSGRA